MDKKNRIVCQCLFPKIDKSIKNFLFFNVNIVIMVNRTLKEVFNVILERKASENENSYVVSLMKKGTDSILKKIGEEAAEVIIATKNENHQESIHELADLWFHSMILMAHNGISFSEIEIEFGRRFGQSGLEEKAKRLK